MKIVVFLLAPHCNTQHIMTPHYADTKNNASALFKQTKLLQLVQKTCHL